MSDRNRLIRGEVEGIGWGVRSDETANLLGLPFVARSLNWVRVAQRYPGDGAGSTIRRRR